MADVKFQSQVYVGASIFQCVESYESIVSRLKESATHVQEDWAGGESLRYAAPLELTVQGQGNRPVRVAVSSVGILAVLELPVDEHVDVHCD